MSIVPAGRPGTAALESDEVVDEPISDVRWRGLVRVEGRIRSMRVRPWAGEVRTLECTVVDDTGGIEIVFHPEEALAMAAQTALGAASLLLDGHSHPEREIDSVTTPRGCTIAGLNEMEHRGFSSAMIKGIVTSAAKAEQLYTRSDKS